MKSDDCLVVFNKVRFSRNEAHNAPLIGNTSTDLWHTRPEFTILFPCSTQLSTKFILPINV